MTAEDIEGLIGQVREAFKLAALNATRCRRTLAGVEEVLAASLRTRRLVDSLAAAEYAAEYGRPPQYAGRATP